MEKTAFVELLKISKKKERFLVFIFMVRSKDADFLMESIGADHFIEIQQFKEFYCPDQIET